VPRLCELYPDICLTTEEKARKTSVRVAKTQYQKYLFLIRFYHLGGRMVVLKKCQNGSFEKNVQMSGDKRDFAGRDWINRL
jgi:hypothetical protein